jgi:hypothetical protein
MRRFSQKAPAYETFGVRGCAFRFLRGNLLSVRGLWIEDLQIPPGQECSNGSLILLAVVLWRTFQTAQQRPDLSELEGGTLLGMSYETP